MYPVFDIVPYKSPKSTALRFISSVTTRLLRRHRYGGLVAALSREKRQERWNTDSRFLARDSDELAKLKAARRPGRPASSRQDLLQIKTDKERQEYKEGFTVPDITDRATVDGLKAWNGTQGGINVLKFVRIAEETSEMPSTRTEMQLD